MASSSRVRIRRKRDYGTGAMALTEYKVDRVRSRTASCNGLDRWIYDDILEGIDNVATLLNCLDEPTSYKVDRVRSRTASCNGLDRWIYDDILEGIDNVATLLNCLDEPTSYKSFGCRLAYESLRRTNPRAGCSRYGVLG